MNLSFDEMDDLFDTDFGNEDFGIDSEYFENEEYIDDEIEKPLEEKPFIKPLVSQVKPQVKPQVKQEVKERQNMSYDDILKSMNVTVVNGKLVLSKGNPVLSKGNPVLSKGNPDNEETGRNQVENSPTKKVQLSQDPIPQEVKNSAIYNKYFKTYNSIQPTVEVRRPRSVQEYRQMLLEDKIKRIQAKRRIDMIKPKTLLFSRDSNPVINMRQPTNLNNVFNFPR